MDKEPYDIFDDSGKVYRVYVTKREASLLDVGELKFVVNNYRKKFGDVG